MRTDAPSIKIMIGVSCIWSLEEVKEGWECLVRYKFTWSSGRRRHWGVGCCLCRNWRMLLLYCERVQTSSDTDRSGSSTPTHKHWHRLTLTCFCNMTLELYWLVDISKMNGLMTILIMNWSFQNKNLKHLHVRTLFMTVNEGSVCFGLLIGQRKKFEDVILGTTKLWWAVDCRLNIN